MPVITVADLVGTENLHLEVVACLHEAGRPLTGTSANEHADPTPWLSGGELLMTDGLELGSTRAAATAYVQRLQRVGVAALALGVGQDLPYQRVPPALIKACERAGLPLVRVPSATPFARITETLYGRLAEERFGDAARMVEAQRALTIAAARPASSPAVAAVVSELTGLWTIVCDIRGSVLASGPDAPPVGAELLEAMRAMAPKGLRATAALPWAGGHARIHPVGAENSRGFLVYGARAGTISGFAEAVASFALSLLSIDLERQLVVRTLERRPREDALGRLLKGLPAAPAARLLSSLGVSAPRVKVAVISAGGDMADLVDNLYDALPEALIRAERVIACILLPSEALDVNHRLNEIAAGRPVGIGGPVLPASCPASYRQAQHALLLARREGGGVVDAMTLGSSRILLQTGTPDMLKAYADAVLRPLEVPDGPGTLLPSLRAWLHACGSWDTAANAVGVHRHTMRQRMRRVEQLTGRSLDNAHDRGELWLAFEARDVAAAAAPA
jgi:purine catabolism regulator